MESEKQEHEKMREVVKGALKHHYIIPHPLKGSFTYKAPINSFYEMHIHENRYGVMMNGDAGSLVVDFKDLRWIAQEHNMDYFISKLSVDFHSQKEVKPYLVAAILKDISDTLTEEDLDERVRQELQDFHTDYSSYEISEIFAHHFMGDLTEIEDSYSEVSIEGPSSSILFRCMALQEAAKAYFQHIDGVDNE
jgi:hypothetical protein